MVDLEKLLGEEEFDPLFDTVLLSRKILREWITEHTAAYRGAKTFIADAIAQSPGDNDKIQWTKPNGKTKSFPVKDVIEQLENQIEEFEKISRCYNYMMILSKKVLAIEDARKTIFSNE